MKIYLLRHSEVANPPNIVYGRKITVHLNAKGIKHATEIGKRFKLAKISRIYTSPLDRAIETSYNISKKININKNNIFIMPKLTERDLGKWEGVPFDVFKEKNKTLNYGQKAETVNKCGQRMIQTIKQIIKENPKDNILVVSHGDPIMCFLISVAKLNNIKKTYPYPSKGEFYPLTVVKDKWHIGRINKLSNNV